MIFYIVLWSVFLMLSIQHLITKTMLPRWFYMVVILGLSIFVVGCRYYVGTDWFNYVSYYYTGISVGKEDGRLEPLFTLFRNVCYSLGFSHAVFFSIISFISLSMVYVAALKFKIDNIALVFLCYLSLFFCNNQFNIIRQGVLISCVWLSFAYKAEGSVAKALICLLFGCGFHYAGFFFIPMVFVIDKPYGRLVVFFGFLLAIGLYLSRFAMNIDDYFPSLAENDRVEGYFNNERWGDRGLSAGFFFNLMILVGSYFYFSKEYDNDVCCRVLINGLFWAIVVGFSMNSLSVFVQRIGNCLNMSLIFLWCYIFNKLKTKIPLFRIFLGLVFLIYLALYFNVSLQAQNKYMEYTMVPYRIDICQLRSNWYGY